MPSAKTNQQDNNSKMTVKWTHLSIKIYKTKHSDTCIYRDATRGRQNYLNLFGPRKNGVYTHNINKNGLEHLAVVSPLPDPDADVEVYENGSCWLD